ncbi:ABC transporter substrate-binding protein [soil metagenome]
MDSRNSIPRLLAVVVTLLLVAAACAGPGATTAPGTTGAETTAPESMAPESMAPESMAPESTAPESTAPESVAPESMEPIGGSISIIGSWTDAEQESFLAMLQPWADATGVQVNYVGTRDMQTQLTAAIEGGGAGLPDVAGIPGPGLMRDWFERGALKPLDFIDQQAYIDAAPPGLAELGQTDDGTLAGIFFKAAVKGFIWYATESYDGTVPATWADVQAIDSAPAESRWCVAFESGAASGWPGTDWIEDIVIRQSGPDAYDAWVAGELAWTSDEVKGAFEEFATVLENTAGGSNTILTTAFQNGGNGLFTDPPECLFHHQASFMSDFLTDPARANAAPEDFDFFVMPDIDPAFAGAVTGGGDLFGMFNDTPQAQSLINWLITPEAQAIWAARGGFIAANTNVPVDVYADAPSQKSAETLQRSTGFRFDGSDSMPGEMNEAFFRAMVDFAQNPGNLDSILQRLDEVQESAYAE